MPKKVIVFEKKYCAYISLVKLIAKRGLHKKKNAEQILNITKEKFDLILSGDFNSLKLEEITKWTATIITYYQRKAKQK